MSREQSRLREGAAAEGKLGRVAATAEEAIGSTPSGGGSLHHSPAPTKTPSTTPATCRICSRMAKSTEFTRGLCPDCNRAFAEGYSAGWTSRDDEDDAPVGCKHGNDADLCDACKAEEAKKEQRRLTRQEILDKMSAPPPGCRACGAYGDLSRYRLCPDCNTKYLEYLAELVAKNPPPMPAPQPVAAPPAAPVARGWMSRLAEMFGGSRGR